MLSSTQYSSALRYTELQYRLSRMVMGREVGVYYSSTSRRFMFDLAGARF